MPWRRRRVSREEVTAGAPRPRPLLWPWLVLLLLLVGGLIAAAVLLTRDDSKPRVPSVVGLSTAAAVRDLGQHGYVADVRTRVSAGAEPGKVVSQEPAGGTRLDRGGRVTLVAARGAATSVVPDVTGLAVDQAFVRLQAAGLKGNTTKATSTRRPDTVLKQDPAAATRAQKGSTVLLTISKGTSTTTGTTSTTTTPTTTTPESGSTVPKVVGMGQSSAFARLEGRGFRADSFPVASSRARGLVVSQRPAGGTRAPPRTVVSLSVSLGPGARPLRVVPDVTNKTESAAKHVLVQLGFTVRAFKPPSATDIPSPRNVVVEQKPSAGARVRAGSQVLIYLGPAP
jgi:serine/threonine-protein kinase